MSSSYIETANENEKAEWMKLFRKLGLKPITRIFFFRHLPKLSTIEAESLDSVVAMMTKHLKSDLKDKGRKGNTNYAVELSLIML